MVSPALARNKAERPQKRAPTLLVDIAVRMDRAVLCREDEIKRRLGARERPLPECVYHHRRERHVPIAGSGLWAPHRVLEIGTLTDTYNPGGQVDMVPRQAAEL